MTEQFKAEESKESLPEGAGFKRPDGWQEGMEEVKEMLDVPLSSIGRGTEQDN